MSRAGFLPADTAAATRTAAMESRPTSYFEVVGNVHLHTHRSDGTGTHAEIAAAARQAGLDFVIPTDHNVLVGDQEGWYDGTLLLVGEETNDPDPPAANHYLALGITQDVASLGGRPQALIDEVRRQGGFGFIAHPCERAGRFIDEPVLDWTHWDVAGYAGIELWNYMSELKSYLTTLPATLWAVFFPQAVIRGPFPETLALYDRLLAQGRRVAISGGSDAHARGYSLGPLHKVVYPYAALFGAVNLHLLLPQPLGHDLPAARAMIYAAMQHGRGFVGYGVLGDPRGFAFTARPAGGGEPAMYGDEVAAGPELLFEVQAPRPAHLRLLRDGVVVAETNGARLEYRSAAAGVYRVEAYRRAWLRRRGWVFTNPIYVRGGTP